MKISKSKRKLAQLLIEAGVKQFPDGANWAAQDKDDKTVYMHSIKPERQLVGDNHFSHRHTVRCRSWLLPVVIPNWHQTVLRRAEFDQIVAESAEQGELDADGWIEWKGGECPVDDSALVVLKMRYGGIWRFGKPVSAGIMKWGHDGDESDIIAYCLHKPEQVDPQCCESVTRSIPEPVTAPTLDQLLQDYRNAADFAAAKQAEADEAAKMRDERWKAAQARALDLGVRISVELVVDAEMREYEQVITDWRDLQLGDEIEVIESNQYRCNGMIGIVSRFDEADHQQPIRVIFDGNERDYDWPTKWRFIRRP